MLLPFLHNKVALVLLLFVLGCLGVSRRSVYVSPSRLVTFPPGSLWGWKTTWAPPGGAGVDVEVAASAQLSKGSEQRRGGAAADAEERARTLSRLQPPDPPRRFPFRALARRRPLCPVPPPEPSWLFPPFPLPPPRPPPPTPALGRRRGKPREPRGTESRDENVLGEKAKSCAQLGGGKKSFWWRRVWSRPRRRLAARASFPFPGSGPRAWLCRDGRGLPPPRAPAGEDRPPLRTALGRPEAPCPGDAEMQAAGSARTRLQLKDVSSMQAKHTPWPQGGEAGDFNHLSNVRSGPKTSPPCADLSSLEQTSRLSDVGGRHRFQAHSPST